MVDLHITNLLVSTVVAVKCHDERDADEPIRFEHLSHLCWRKNKNTSTWRQDVHGVGHENVNYVGSFINIELHIRTTLKSVYTIPLYCGCNNFDQAWWSPSERLRIWLRCHGLSTTAIHSRQASKLPFLVKKNLFLGNSRPVNQGDISVDGGNFQTFKNQRKATQWTWREKRQRPISIWTKEASSFVSVLKCGSSLMHPT